MYIHSQIVIVCYTVNCFMSVMKIIRTLQDFLIEHRHEQSDDFKSVNDLEDYFSIYCVLTSVSKLHITPLSKRSGLYEHTNRVM